MNMVVSPHFHAGIRGQKKGAAIGRTVRCKFRSPAHYQGMSFRNPFFFLLLDSLPSSVVLPLCVLSVFAASALWVLSVFVASVLAVLSAAGVAASADPVLAAEGASAVPVPAAGGASAEAGAVPAGSGVVPSVVAGGL